MQVFGVLAIAWILFRSAGALGVDRLNDTIEALRWALAVMFLLTASAHWGKRRPDLIRMVPPRFPNPDLLVTITGLLEIAGAIGLLIPATARLSAACLAAMLIAMFPANVYGARHHLPIGGRPATPLPLRTVLQIVFVGALLATVFG